MTSADPRVAADASGTLLVAAICFSVAAVARPPLAVVLSGAGLALGISSATLGRPALDGRQTQRVVSGAVLAAVVVASAAPLITVPDVTELDLAVWLGPVVIVAGVGFLWSYRSEARLPGLIAALAVLGVTVAGTQVMLAHAGSDVGIDVYAAHLAASDALADGLNPYTAAATYFDGYPGRPPGAVIEGYGYPPVALVGYAVSTWLTGDPRWLNLVSWLAVLGLVAWRAMKSKDQVAALALLVLAANPAWRLVVYSGWTEVLTIALLVFAADAWRRHPRLAVLLLGLALGSKQYLALLAPLLLLVPGRESKWRMIAAQSVAVVSMVPFLVWNPGALINALVVRQLGFGFRADSQSLAGVFGTAGREGLFLIAGLVAATALTALFARRPSLGTLLTGMGTVLGAFFFFHIGMVNYWYLISALVAAGVVFRHTELAARGESGYSPSAAHRGS